MPAIKTVLPQIYLSKVHLKGFKSIEDLTIDLKRGLNLLIGKNGAGKSNFLEFIAQAISTNRNSKLFFKAIKLEFISTDNHSFALELEKILQTNKRDNDIEDRIEIAEKFTVDNKLVFDSTNKTDLKGEFYFNNKKTFYRSTLKVVFRRMGYQSIRALYLKFSLPNNLDGIEQPATITIDTENNFWDYPSSLNFLVNIFFQLEISYEGDENDFKNTITKPYVRKFLKFPESLKTNLTSYSNLQDVRFVNGINLYSDDKTIVIDNIKLEFKINGNWLPWSQLSDGTKRLFYLICEITDSIGLILIEEPELGIHPHQFSLLMDFLREQAEDKQIIISTHSPKALDILSSDELNNILIAYYDPSKGTQIKHLSEKEEHKAKRYMKEVGFFSDYWMNSDLEE